MEGVKTVFIIAPLENTTEDEVKDVIQKAKLKYCEMNHIHDDDVEFLDTLDHRQFLGMFVANASAEVYKEDFGKIVDKSFGMVDMTNKRAWLINTGSIVAALAAFKDGEDFVVFTPGWKKSSMCKILSDVCIEYNIPTTYLNEV